MNYADLKSAFILMGQGMLGIFIVMVAIAIVIYCFNKLSQ